MRQDKYESPLLKYKKKSEKGLYDYMTQKSKHSGALQKEGKADRGQTGPIIWTLLTEGGILQIKKEKNKHKIICRRTLKLPDQPFTRH